MTGCLSIKCQKRCARLLCDLDEIMASEMVMWSEVFDVCVVEIDVLLVVECR